MDEILIDEKRYISSKRAAKATGYAKDYIGQLCREGRVPAQFVGRSWYVLESAIQDHRFGDRQKESVTEEQKDQATWESPRYEAASVEALPALPEETVTERLQDSWKEWFDRVVEPEHTEVEQETPEETPVQEEVPVTVERTISVDAEAEPVTIHTTYDLPPQDLLPRLGSDEEREEEDIEELQREIQPRGGLSFVVVRGLGLVLAVILLISATISTGYFDKIVSSYSQASVITGIKAYNK